MKTGRGDAREAVNNRKKNALMDRRRCEKEIFTSDKRIVRSIGLNLVNAAKVCINMGAGWQSRAKHERVAR